jgi:5'-3' exonuclease
MGIPSYFRYITTQYENIIIKQTPKQINRLFLDLNCAIHPQAHKVLSENPTLKSNTTIENKIYASVVDYIKYILTFVQPTDLLFIAIDGVAPRAKMQQQRYRRFKTGKEKKDTQKMYAKYNEPMNKSDWDTNTITPGTPFMTKLSKYLKTELKQLTNNIKIILSDSNDYSEGEHKIYKYIRKNKSPDSSKPYIDAIYGLDADLIMLSMTVKDGNIYLLREAVEFGNMIMNNEIGQPVFLYLDINEFKNSILDELKENGLKITDEYRIVCDYIFMCFFLGNDFLPHTSCLSIKDGGINILLEYYLEILYEEEKDKKKQKKNKTIKENEEQAKVSVKLGKYLVEITKNKYSINNEFLRRLISKISEHENELLIINTKHLMRGRIHHKEHKNELEKQLHFYKYLPVFDSNRNIDKYINMGSNNWRQRYYETCFNTQQEKEIDFVCFNYLQGLTWTLKYYFEDCVSYSWYYKFRNPPAMLDIKYFLDRNNCDINKIVQVDKEVYSPFIQLLIVLPSSSSGLLPKSYQSLSTDKNSPIFDLYPKYFELDTVGKHMTWQCHPVLPDVDDERIINAIEKLKLTKEEQTRNSKKNKIIIKEKSTIKK